MVDMLQINALRKGVGHGMTGAEMQSELLDKTLDYEYVELLFYLYPDDFKPYTQTEFEVRQLFEDDKDALDALKSACTPQDVDEGWVHVTDELCYGAFDGDKMVACATMFEWRGFADPGVLVHPAYRRRGLGKAVVSAICQWVLDHGRVMNYRCVSTNIGSAEVARSLGFTQYFEIEEFKVINRA
jgi:GNAT superfamily N-acetyltransferase